MKFSYTLILLLFIFASATSYAQKTTTVKPTAFVKFRAPKLTTLLGTYKDTSYISARMIDSIIGLPLQIFDAKNNRYTLSSYQFLYKKIVTTEDEATGKASKSSSIKSAIFKTSPLPPLWLYAIREDAKPSEELFFFAVIAKDAQGRIMYAPDLKIILR